MRLGGGGNVKVLKKDEFKILSMKFLIKLVFYKLIQKLTQSCPSEAFIKKFESLRTLQQREFLWGAREIKNLRFEVRDERRSLRTSTFPNPMFILVVIAQSLVEAVAALQNGFYSKTIQLKVQPFFSNSCRSRFFLPLSTWMAFIWLCFHYYARKGLDLMSLVQTAIDAFDNYQRVSNGAVWLLW